MGFEDQVVLLANPYRTLLSNTQGGEKVWDCNLLIAPNGELCFGLKIPFWESKYTLCQGLCLRSSRNLPMSIAALATRKDWKFFK